MSGKHIVIGGGSGFIGSALNQALQQRGDRVTLISRTAGPGRITWSDLISDGLPECDAVINLAGKHILNLTERWNDQYRNELINSRVETTRTLVDAINRSSNPPEVFISTAGKCFYGTCEMNEMENYPELDEYSEPMGQDFAAEIVQLWEAAADHLDTTRVRHIKLRIGIVLGNLQRTSLAGRLWRIGSTRGILPAIRIFFCLGLGASIGSGKQPFPWIHITDMVNLIMQTIDDRSMVGKYNGVAPGIVNNREFTRAFAKALRRPVLWSIPNWLVHWMIGSERASILLEGQLVKPTRTLQSGFQFRFPEIGPALNHLTKITL